MKITLGLIVALCALSAAPLEAWSQSSEPPAASAGEGAKTKSPWLAAGLNFVLPGAGYLYNGEKPLYVALPLLVGAGGLTYLEQFHAFGDDGQTLLDYDRNAFIVLFSSVFVINTGLAIDAWLEADAINDKASRKQEQGLSFGLGVLPGKGGEASYSVTVGSAW